jgi:hypothetical protein
MMLVIIKVIASFVEFFAAIMFALSLFRIPLNYPKIAVVAITMAASGAYLREIPELSQYASLTILVFAVILIGLFFTLPIFYSLLIIIMCFLAGVLLEYSISVVSIYAGLTNPSLLQTNIWHYFLLMIFTALLTLALTFFISTRKIGFHFMANRFSIRQSIKAYNFAIYALLITSITLIQIISSSYIIHFQMHGTLLFIVAIIFLIGIYITYKQNRRQIDEKYERLLKK